MKEMNKGIYFGQFYYGKLMKKAWKVLILIKKIMV